ALFIDRLRAAGEAVAGAVRGDGDGGGLLAAFQSEEQRQIMDRVTAVMSLAEGHGDYVMDGVGADVVPSVEKIRGRFQKRREATNPLDRIMRQLLGMELKMKQYEEGAALVGAVVAEVGMAEFNKVWGSREALPTLAEIRDPHAWVDRVVRAAAIPERGGRPPPPPPDVRRSGRCCGPCRPGPRSWSPVVVGPILWRWPVRLPSKHPGRVFGPGPSPSITDFRTVRPTEPDTSRGSFTTWGWILC